MTHDEIRERNMEKVVHCALDLFYSQGIANTKISEIAKSSGLTPTSVYRYYNDKDTIVIHAAKLMAKMYSDSVIHSFYEHDFHNKTGYEQIEMILRFFIDTARSNKRFLMLVNEVFAYIQQLEASRGLKLPKSGLDVFFQSSISIKALQKGIDDGSIRNDIDVHKTFELATSCTLGTMLVVYGKSVSWKSDFPTYLAEGCMDLILTYLRPNQSKL